MTPRPVDPATITAKLARVEDLLDALAVIGPVDGDRLRRAAVTDAAEAGLIEAPLAESLAAASGLRNLLVRHDGRVDHDRVAAAGPLTARDARRFVDQVSRWVLDRG